MARLVDLATTIRSKNAGVDHITFDVIFSDPSAYRRVLASRALTREAVVRLLHVAPQDVTHFAQVDAAHHQVHVAAQAAERVAGRDRRLRFAAIRSSL